VASEGREHLGKEIKSIRVCIIWKYIAAGARESRIEASWELRPSQGLLKAVNRLLN
jgi:hypothetical protein